MCGGCKGELLQVAAFTTSSAAHAFELRHTALVEQANLTIDDE